MQKIPKKVVPRINQKTTHIKNGLTYLKKRKGNDHLGDLPTVSMASADRVGGGAGSLEKWKFEEKQKHT